jgi:hypothetical protein
MKKTMMYLPEDMHRYLARIARERGVSMAEVAREAISEYRTSREETVAKGVSALVGVFGDDVADPLMSETIDEVLAEHFAPGGPWEQENVRDDDSR